MLKIGITGGIGSGKSTVCRLFALHNIPVYDADSRAKWLMSSDTGLINAIKKYFGREVYDQQGNLNRKFLGDIVFHNREKLSQLNKLVHPAVIKDHQRWHEKQKNCPYTLKEAALMFESGSYKKLDLTILVTAPMELRIQRAMARDNNSREEILSRLKKQWSEAQRKKLADLIIMNDEKHSLIEQVNHIHQQLSQLR